MRDGIWGVFVVAGVSVVLWVPTATVAEIGTISGPVQAQVIRVTDGDTLHVMAEPWPTTFHRVAIRIAGIDAPEMRGGCEASKVLAREAGTFLAALLGVETAGTGHIAIGAPLVTLRNIRPGKFQGRMLADVFTAAGENVGARLLAEGLAKPWDGSGARPGWCG